MTKNLEKLIRLTNTALLFEDEYYVDGESVLEGIQKLAAVCDPVDVADLAVQAATEGKLRHVPLILCVVLAKNGKLKASTLTDVITRPDSMGEFLSLYWRDGRCPLSNQVKKGLANAFHKFNEYSFAKWNFNSADIKVRDVMFLTHPKPKTVEQRELFNKIANNTLQTPDTWETRLSSGEDKKAVFEDLMANKRLAALAALRNIRGMYEVGIGEETIKQYILDVNPGMVLPSQFLKASKIAKEIGLKTVQAACLHKMMFSNRPKNQLKGSTAVLVDVSGSMFTERIEHAVALAILSKVFCEHVHILTFSRKLVYVGSRVKAIAMEEAIVNSQAHSTTELYDSVEKVLNTYDMVDRLLVITDEQDNGSSYRSDLPALKNNVKGYIMNVAPYEKGVSTSDGWEKISGLSERVFNYMQKLES